MAWFVECNFMRLFIYKFQFLFCDNFKNVCAINVISVIVQGVLTTRTVCYEVIIFSVFYLPEIVLSFSIIWISVFFRILESELSVVVVISFTQPLKYKSFKVLAGMPACLHQKIFFKDFKIFSKFPNTNLDSRKNINLLWIFFFAHSFFAAAKILHTSILLGQKFLHFPQLRHKSRYFSMFLFSFKSPFKTPSSITNLPR